MSYARFGAEGSDVYLYGDATLGGVTCCMCALQAREWVDDEESFFGGYLRDVGQTIKINGLSTDEMLAHLSAHRAAGHHVCEGVEEEIEADRAENDAALDDEYRAKRDAERRERLRASLAGRSDV